MANKKKKKGEIRIGREIGGEKDRAGERKKEERKPAHGNGRNRYS